MSSYPEHPNQQYSSQYIAWILDGDNILVCENSSQTSSPHLPPTLASISLNKFSNDPSTLTKTDGIVCLLSSEIALSQLTDATHSHSSTNPPLFAVSYDFALQHHLLPESAQYHWVSYRSLLSQLPLSITHSLSRAMQLLRWQADHQFCSRCGTLTQYHAHSEHAKTCPNCHYHQYPRLQPCVITLITRSNPDTGRTEMLLAHHHRFKQVNNPMYGLIAGFVEVGESLEAAVCREVLEEVGLTVNNLRFFGSQPSPFPSNLMIGFIADYVSGNITLQEDELVDAQFFDIDTLPTIPPFGSIAYDLIQHVCQTSKNQH